MGIYRGIGGTGDSIVGEDIFGPNTSITQLTGIEGPITTPTYIKFAEDANHTALQGELTWNTSEGTLDLGLNEGHVILQIGEEVLYRITNQSGATITDGTLVMFDGTTGNSGKLKAKPWDGVSATKTIMGIATENILNGENGYVTHFGKVRAIQTNGANYSETWVDGDILYAGPTGGLTKTLPSAPKSKTPVAVVVHAHGSNGTLFVRVQHGSNLGEDELVQLASLTNGDILQYNSVTGRFENVDAAIVAGSISDGDKGDITVSSSGSVWTVDNSAITYAKIQNVSATDKLLGRSTVGAGVVEEITCTAAGRALLDDASASDQRTTLGLAIGTNVQAYSANLDEYAAVNPTTAGLALLDDVDNAAQRTTLGLGTIATQAANSVAITGGSITGITDLTVTDGGTGLSTLTANNVILGNGTSSPLFVAPSTSGNVLTSNGTTWTSAQPTGLNLLGTLTTTSGTTQVLSGLVLTDYKQLVISIDRVGHSNTAAGYNFRLASLALSALTLNTEFCYGLITIDLQNNGAFTSFINNTLTSGTNVGSIPNAGIRAGELGITTATTSLTFDWSTASTFDSGTIKVWGAK